MRTRRCGCGSSAASPGQAPQPCRVTGGPSTALRSTLTGQRCEYVCVWGKWAGSGACQPDPDSCPGPHPHISCPCLLPLSHAHFLMPLAPDPQPGISCPSPPHSSIRLLPLPPSPSPGLQQWQQHHPPLDPAPAGWGTTRRERRRGDGRRRGNGARLVPGGGEAGTNRVKGLLAWAVKEGAYA